MNVDCRRNTFVQIFYSTGSSGNFAQRTMRQGTSVLGYNFYFEPARVSILGDGTGGSFYLQGLVGNAGANITLYGRIPPGQDPSVGPHRSEERRGGKECVSKCSSRWVQYH